MMPTWSIVSLSITGYIICGLVTARLMLRWCYLQNRVLTEDNYFDAYLCGALWPLAALVATGSAIGKWVLVPLVTPGIVRKDRVKGERKKVADREQREAERAAREYNLDYPTLEAVNTAIILETERTTLRDSNRY